MNLELINYQQYLEEIPKEGKHILGQQTADQIVIYQAFNPQIAKYAIENQVFGGNHYNFSRMSWIKPNFLWMMYRCGWAAKPNQERVLAIWINKTDFDKILAEAVFSNYQDWIYGSHENWKAALATKEVRLQWDPDHDIYGNKQERRAIQLGMKGKMLNVFGKEMVNRIEDITDFVKTQKQTINSKKLEALQVPKESIYSPENAIIKRGIGLE